MEAYMVKILGICGSPVKDSNTELLLGEALKAVERAEVRTDLFTLHGKKFEDCRHCNWCMAKQTENNFCVIKDDMNELFPKVVGADALLVASPVYLARMSGHLASVLDRLRCIHYGKQYAGAMKYKVGAAIALSWFRNSGIETTLNTIHWAFFTYQMVIAVPGSTSTFGGAGLTSLSGTGEFDPKDKHQVLKDTYGIQTAIGTAKSMVELAEIVSKGRKGV
jgi:multimeric flavodoxin WrbA